MDELITKKDADSIQDQRKAFAKWMTIAHQEPEKVAVNKFANNTKYVPISYVEMKLDEMFIDGWNREIKSHDQVLNSVVVVVRISAFNPSNGRDFFRDGIGSKALQLKRGSSAMDIASLQPNACELAYPAATTQAVKNAAQSIGKVFGRDVARELNAEFNSMVEIIDQSDIDLFIHQIDGCTDQKSIQNTMARLKKELELMPDVYAQIKSYAAKRYKEFENA